MSTQFQTSATQLFGTRLPIVAGGLMWLADANYVAAAGRAGIIGFITQWGYLGIFLMMVAEPTYVGSVTRDERGGDVRSHVRTSDGSTVHWLIEDPAIHAINRRLAAMSGSSVEQGEPLQILCERDHDACACRSDGANDRRRRAIVHGMRWPRPARSVFSRRTGAGFGLGVPRGD